MSSNDDTKSSSPATMVARSVNEEGAPPSPLAGLLAYIAEQAPHKYVGKQAGAAMPSEPPETDYFQKTWERLSPGLRLKQSQLQVPDNAGPLNSNQLIHRALLLMRDQSPDYLRHFLTYVDALSWMEQLNAGAAPKNPPRAASPKKSPRKPR